MINPNDLRALADFLDEHPDLAKEAYVSGTVFATRDSWPNLLRELGTYEKAADDRWLNARRKFGDLVLEVTITKSLTCEQIQIGEREVEREVYPDSVVPTIEKVTEPVYEWRCPDSWLRAEVA